MPVNTIMSFGINFPINAINIIHLIEKITSISIVIQSVEYLVISKATETIWKWPILKKELGNSLTPLARHLDFMLKFPNFKILLILRLILSIALFFYPHPLFLAFLLYSTILILLRWRGTFNGGSDFMTLIVLISLFVASVFTASDAILSGCLWYITLQTCSSYFISGIIKLRSVNWRTGHALKSFLYSSVYTPDRLIHFIASRKWILFILSWFVILFECSFPIVLFDTHLCWIYLLIAICFHISIAYLFGLNRFLLAWGSTYPALIFCSSSHIIHFSAHLW